MATKSDRYFKADIENKKYRLPKLLAFLRDVKYFSLSKERVKSVYLWHVEVPASFLKSLLISNKRGVKSSVENKKLRAVIAVIKRDLRELQIRADQLEQDNEGMKLYLTKFNELDAYDMWISGKHDQPPEEPTHKMFSSQDAMDRHGSMLTSSKPFPGSCGSNSR